MKTFGGESCFVFIDGVIWIFFDFEHPLTCLWRGREVRVQVSFSRRGFYLDYIALNHSGWANACSVVADSECTMKAFCLELSVLALVSIKWLLTKNVGLEGWLWNEGDKDFVGWDMY